MMLRVSSPAYLEPLRSCAPRYPPPYALPGDHPTGRPPFSSMASHPERSLSPSASTPSPSVSFPLTSHTASTASSPVSSPSHSHVHPVHAQASHPPQLPHGSSLPSPIVFPHSPPHPLQHFHSAPAAAHYPSYPASSSSSHSLPGEPSMSDDEESVLSSVDSDNGADGLDFNSAFPSSAGQSGLEGGTTAAGLEIPSASTHHRTASGGASSAAGAAGYQRVPKACSACRKRKRRCDGQQPCSSCHKANKPAGCNYQQGVRRRGPQAGMVQRLRDQVKNLQAQLEHVSGHPSVRSAAGEAGDSHSASHVSTSILALFHQPDSPRKVAVYRGTFFRLINDTLFPMLVQSDFDSCYDMYEHSLSTAPAVWHLTLAAVLANGAHIWGDFAFAAEATEIARAAAAPLFDQPSAEVIRGLLVLAYHCLSDNALSKSSCYLATITRMCEIVDIPPEVPLLTHWLEDILCASRTFAQGLRTMPEGSYQAPQRAAFPQDWSRYERLVHFYRTQAQERNRRPRRNTQPSGKAAPPSLLSSSTSSSSAAASSGTSSSSASAAVSDFTAPPDARDLDDRNIRWELLQTLCAISESKGEYNRATPQSVYHHLCVLTKAEQSPLTAGLLMSTIAFCKSQALFFVNEQAEAVEMARAATKSMLTHDVQHCAFYTLQLHFVSQVHLRMNDFQHLAVSLSIMRTVGRHWKFGLAPLRHIEQVIQHAIVHPSSPFIPNHDDSAHAFEPVHMLPPEDRQQAESFYHSSLPLTAPTSPAKPTDRELSPRSFSARSAQLLALFQQPALNHPNISDTINSIDANFPYAFHPPPSATGQSRMRDIAPAAAPVSGGEEPPPSHSDAHPHPHLFSLRPPANAVPIRFKKEDVQITPDAVTRATTQPSHAVNGLRDPRKSAHSGPATPAATLSSSWMDRRREMSSPAVVQRAAVAAVPLSNSNSSSSSSGGYAMSALPLISAVPASYSRMDDASAPYTSTFLQSTITTAAQSQRVQYDALLSPTVSEIGSMYFDPTAFPGPSSPFLTPPPSASEPSLLSTGTMPFHARHFDGQDVGLHIGGLAGTPTDMFAVPQGRAEGMHGVTPVLRPHPHGVITLSHFPTSATAPGTTALPISTFPFPQVPRAFTPQPPGLDGAPYHNDPSHRH